MHAIQLAPTMFNSLQTHIHRLTDQELDEFLDRSTASVQASRNAS